MEAYDAVIIGFGKAGKTLAASLGKAGWSVALIEQSPQMYGGTCINIACIPTKTLLHDANIPPRPSENLADRYEAAIKRKDDVTSLLRGKNFSALNEALHVTVYTGHARFVDTHELQITAGNDALSVRGEKLFINTGTEPRIPPIDGAESSPYVYTSTTLMEQSGLPKRLLIIGAGNVALEFATMYRQFGSEVTVLARGERILEREDPDIAAAVQQELESLDIRFIFNADAQGITDQRGWASVAYQTGETTAKAEADAVLLATGRSPVTRDLGLDTIGVKRDDRGFIEVDARLRTSVEDIWALGDINGGPQFTYISLDDYRIVKDQLLGDGKRSTSDRQAVPSTLFVNPPLARVGITETEARAAGHDIAVATLPVSAVPRSRVNNDTRGVLKAVVDSRTKRILGAALFCTNADEVINAVALAMSLDQEYGVLRDRIYTHPSMSEALNDLFSLIDDQV